MPEVFLVDYKINTVFSLLGQGEDKMEGLERAIRLESLSVTDRNVLIHGKFKHLKLS